MRRVSVPVALLVLLGSLGLLLSKYRAVPFHSDESGWISAGNHYADLLLRFEFNEERWRCPECTTFGEMNLQLGKLLIGIPQRLLYNQSDPFFGIYRTEKTLAWNQFQGLVPSDEALFQARVFSCVFGALCVTLLFLLGASVSPWVGLGAVVLLLGTGFFRDIACKALTDIHFNVFLLVVAGCVLLYAAARSARRAFVLSIVCGVATGLACSIKITGIVVGTGIYTIGLFYSHRVWRPSIRSCIARWTAFFGSAVAVIYLLNPVFWPSVEIRGGFPVVTRVSNLLEFPRLFPRWKAYQETIAKGGSPLVRSDRVVIVRHGYGGDKIRKFHTDAFVSTASFSVEWVLLVVGLVFCVRRTVVSWQRREFDPAVLFLVSFVVNYLLVFVFQPVNFQRYFLPFLIPSKLISALGVLEVARIVAKRAVRPSTESRPSS